MLPTLPYTCSRSNACPSLQAHLLEYAPSLGDLGCNGRHSTPMDLPQFTHLPPLSPFTPNPAHAHAKASPLHSLPSPFVKLLTFNITFIHQSHEPYYSPHHLYKGTHAHARRLTQKLFTHTYLPKHPPCPLTLCIRTACHRSAQTTPKYNATYTLHPLQLMPFPLTRVFSTCPRPPDNHNLKHTTPST